MVMKGLGGRKEAGQRREVPCCSVRDEVTNSSVLPPSRMKPAGCSSALQLSHSPVLPNTPCAGWLQQDTKLWMGKLGLHPANTQTGALGSLSSSELSWKPHTNTH